MGTRRVQRVLSRRAGLAALGLCALLVVSGVASSALADPAQQRQEVERQREEVRRQLEQQRGELDETEEEMRERLDELDEIESELDVTIEDVQRLDARISELDQRLAELQADLAEAQGELDDAEARLAATTSELVATEERLDETRVELADERETFAARSRASFVYGGDAAMMTHLLDVADVSEFARSMQYVQSVLADDRDRITRIAGLARQVEAAKRDLETLQDRQIAERAHAESQRDKVANLVAEEEAVRAEVAAEREERRDVMLALEADRDSHEELVASLDQASDEIEAELAELSTEEGQLSEEAQRLAQQEQAARERARREAERARQEAERAASSGGSSGGGSSGGGSSGGGSSGGGSSSSGSTSAPSQGGQLQRPSNGRLTSGYGYRTHPIHGTRRMHAGIDLAAGYGAPIFAADDGVVISAGNRGGYGQTIIVGHGGGLTTLYAHQSRFAVGRGARVSRGQVIGYEGATGAVTGAHLHFEVRVHGQHRDPMPYIR